MANVWNIQPLKNDAIRIKNGSYTIDGSVSGPFKLYHGSQISDDIGIFTTIREARDFVESLNTN